MTTTISRVRAWDLDRVAVERAHLATDDTVFGTASRDVRDVTESGLDGMSGATVDAIRRSNEVLTKDLATLSDACRDIATALDHFHRTVSGAGTALMREVAAAEREGFTVDDDGRVLLPASHTLGVSENRSQSTLLARAEEFRKPIENLLKLIDAADTDAANTLRSLSGQQKFGTGNHADNTDTRSSIAGTAINSQTDGLAGVIRHFAVEAGEDALGMTRFARGLPVFGTALGLTAGIAGAPDGEPIRETLVAESGGAAAGVVASVGAAAATTALGTAAASGLTSMAGGAVAGAAVGSAVPVAGTVIGLVVGGVAGYFASKKIRDHFDDERNAGRTPFA